MSDSLIREQSGWKGESPGFNAMGSVNSVTILAAAAPRRRRFFAAAVGQFRASFAPLAEPVL